MPVEQRVVSPEVQLRLVEQQAYRDAAQLVVFALTQLIIERVQQPAVLTLHLGRDGELVILLWQSLAVLLDDLTDGNPPEHRRGDSQTFEHGESPGNEKRPATQRELHGLAKGREGMNEVGFSRPGSVVHPASAVGTWPAGAACL